MYLNVILDGNMANFFVDVAFTRREMQQRWGFEPSGGYHRDVMEIYITIQTWGYNDWLVVWNHGVL